MSEKLDYRVEQDSLGQVEIKSDKLWGAQSQRSLENFAIGHQQFPAYFIHDFALVKKAAARANESLGLLESTQADLIAYACDEIISGKHDAQFPLSVWQTGSGTQTNMNLNEVIANLGNQHASQPLGSNSPLHPNDHVNMSQSTNDVFPTVMHVTANRLGRKYLMPALAKLQKNLSDKQSEFNDKIKPGRTHMMDATPVTLGQEFGAFKSQLDFVATQFESSLQTLTELAIGGTAVGTGLNSPAMWPDTVVKIISQMSGFQFKPAVDKFSQLSAHDTLSNLHGQLNLLATVLLKIGNDIRLMNSGPRCGLSEISIPANEPGSSIMPGKVNPTQVEALTMVCVRVMGNNTTVTVAASQGQFQLNVYKPLIIHTIMESITLLADSMKSFTEHCLAGITANDQQLKLYTDRSLMLVTALSPHIGYDNAAKAAKHAHEHNLTLKQAVAQLQLLSEDEFNKLVKPELMLGQ